MRLDSANRSFLAFMGLALGLGAFLLCGALGVLVPLTRVRMARHGLSGLLPAGAWLLPALLFVLVVLVCAVRAGCSLARQLTASGRLAHQVQELAMGAPERLRLAASQAGLSGRVVLLDAPAAFSFVYGVLTPRVVVSRGLIEGVSARELRAVLEHERYHVCNLDPLKIVLVRLLTSAFFFLPVLESLRVRYVTARELAADRRAVAICGRPPLAGALLKVVRGPQWSELEVAAPMGDPQLLDVRVAQLESGVQPEARQARHHSLHDLAHGRRAALRRGPRGCLRLRWASGDSSRNRHRARRGHPARQSLLRALRRAGRARGIPSDRPVREPRSGPASRLVDLPETFDPKPRPGVYDLDSRS
jgi:Zn-dependent protease with chaperone function